MLVFDLDGVLLDTRSANLAAYQAVGVTPPEDFHQRPWEEWCSPGHHDAKNRVFPQCLDSVKTLPLFEYAWCRGGAMVVSSISNEAFGALEAKFRLWRGLNLVLGLRLHERLALLRQWGSGVYYDDSRQTCDEVAKLGGWQVCHVQSPFSYPPQATDHDSKVRSMIKAFPSP